MKFKKCIITTLMTIMIFMLSGCTGCGDSPEQKAINEENIARAKTNAVNYVKEKYGLEATVEDAILERNYGLCGSTPTSKVLVKMKCFGKGFNVYIDGETDNTEGYDDYQSDSINEDIKELIEKNVPGVERVVVEGGMMRGVEYDDIVECCDVLYEKYYDGSNLKEVLGDRYYEIFVAFIDKDLSGVTNADFPELLWEDEDRYEVALHLISYRDKDSMNKCEYYSIDSRYAIYIDSYYGLVGIDEKNYHEYKLNKCGDVYYYVEDGLEDYVEINKLLKTVNASDWDGQGAKGAKVVSDAYYINSTKDLGKASVHIFYPTDKINDFDPNEVDYADCEYAAGKYDYTVRSVKNSVIDDYVYREVLPANEAEGESYYFVFLKD